MTSLTPKSTMMWHSQTKYNDYGLNHVNEMNNHYQTNYSNDNTLYIVYCDLNRVTHFQNVLQFRRINKYKLIRLVHSH